VLHVDFIKFAESDLYPEVVKGVARKVYGQFSPKIQEQIIDKFTAEPEEFQREFERTN
jgi:hypothetical protein